MKKNTISMLITALILFAAGFLLTVITLIYTSISKIDIYPGQSKTKPEIGNTVKTFGDMGYAQGDLLRKIELTSLVGSVDVLPTDGESRVEFENTDLNNLDTSFADGVLTVTESQPVGFMGLEVSAEHFGFNGLRQIFRWSNNAKTSKKITLYLNPNDFSTVLNVTSKVGDVKVRDIDCSEMYIVSAVGDITVDGCNLTSALNVKGDKADVFVRDCHYMQAAVNVTIGDVWALVTEHKTNLQTMLGSVTVITRNTKDDYQLRLSTTIGSISPFTFENDKKEFSLYSSSGSSLWCQTVLGSIKLREFDAEKYPQPDYDEYVDLLDLA